MEVEGLLVEIKCLDDSLENPQHQHSNYNKQSKSHSSEGIRR